MGVPESRLPVNPSGMEPLPDLPDRQGPVPFAFPAPGSGRRHRGIVPEDLSYDEDAQIGVYSDSRSRPTGSSA